MGIRYLLLSPAMVQRLAGRVILLIYRKAIALEAGHHAIVRVAVPCRTFHPGPGCKCYD